MSISIAIDGRGTYAGLRTNIVGYSVSEDAIPIDGSDSAAVGQVSFSVVEDPSPEGTIRLLGMQVTLNDNRRGSTVGIVDSISTDNGIAQVRASSRLNRLVVERKARPFSGTFEAAIRYYLSLAGVNESIYVDEILGVTPVALQGWTGDVWLAVKHLCIAHRAEIQLVADNIVVRPIRQFEAVMNRNISESWNLDSTQRARTVEVAYYNNQAIVNSVVFPPPFGSDTGGRISPYRVDKSRVVEDTVEVSASLTSVAPPIAVDAIPTNYDGIQSVYMVRNDDGPISAAEWVANGGSVDATVSDDPSVVNLRIHAPTRNLDGPFTLEDGNGQSALYLVGDGVAYHREILTLSTGADPARTAQVVGETVDIPEVSTLAQAWTLGLHAAAKWGTPRQTIRISTTSINRKGENGDYSYITWGQFEDAVGGDGEGTDAPGGAFGVGGFGTTPFGSGSGGGGSVTSQTWGEFDASWDGYTWGDFDAYWAEQSRDDFVNQGFGNMTGAAARFRDGIYRITSHTTDDVTVDYEAEQDALFGDVEALWEDATWGDFDEFWQYNTWGDVDLSPLKSRSEPTNEPIFRSTLPSLTLAPQVTLVPSG